MAAEISDITESNQPDMLGHFRAASPLPPDAADLLAHILTDVHEMLRMLARHDALLTEFKPLLDQLRSPAASMLTRRTRRGHD